MHQFLINVLQVRSDGFEGDGFGGEVEAISQIGFPRGFFVGVDGAIEAAQGIQSAGVGGVGSAAVAAAQPRAKQQPEQWRQEPEGPSVGGEEFKECVHHRFALFPVVADSGQRNQRVRFSGRGVDGLLAVGFDGNRQRCGAHGAVGLLFGIEEIERECGQGVEPAAQGPDDVGEGSGGRSGADVYGVACNPEFGADPVEGCFGQVLNVLCKDQIGQSNRQQHRLPDDGVGRLKFRAGGAVADDAAVADGAAFFGKGAGGQLRAIGGEVDSFVAVARIGAAEEVIVKIARVLAGGAFGFHQCAVKLCSGVVDAFAAGDQLIAEAQLKSVIGLGIAGNDALRIDRQADAFLFRHVGNERVDFPRRITQERQVQLQLVAAGERDLARPDNIHADRLVDHQTGCAEADR